MNTSGRKLFILCCIACTAPFLCSQAWAITLSFNPATSWIDVGDPIDISIAISGLENENLSTFDLNINYDAAILSFDKYVLGSGLGDLSNPMEAEDWSLGGGGGTVHLSEISLLLDFSWQHDSFTLATVSFTGISMGTSPLQFSNVILGDEWGNELSATLADGSVNVVPVPTTILLMGSGIAGVLGLRKRFKR